jgi:hypothetical protein
MLATAKRQADNRQKKNLKSHYILTFFFIGNTRALTFQNFGGTQSANNRGGRGGWWRPWQSG